MAKYQKFLDLWRAANKELAVAGRRAAKGHRAPSTGELGELAGRVALPKGEGGEYSMLLSKNPNTPANIERLRVLVGYAPNVDKQVRQAAEALVPPVAPYRTRVDTDIFGVPAMLSKRWLQRDMLRLRTYGNAAVSPNPPPFIEGLSAGEQAIAQQDRQTAFPRGVRKAVLHRKNITGVRPLLLGQTELWPAAAQRFPEAIHDKLRGIMNFAVAVEPAPPRMAAELLLKSAGVADDVAQSAAINWWGDLTERFAVNVMGNPKGVRGLQSRGKLPFWTVEQASVARPPKEWQFQEVKGPVREYLGRSDAAAVPGHNRYMTQVANDGTLLSEYMTNYLRQNGSSGDLAKWRAFAAGKGTGYERATRELDGMLAELHQPQLHDFRLTDRHITGRYEPNLKAQHAFMWRMKEPILNAVDVGVSTRYARGARGGRAAELEEAVVGGGIAAPDAYAAELSGKGLAYFASIFKAVKPGKYTIDPRALPHLPPDIRIAAEYTPQKLMESLAPFFSRSALSNNQVSQLRVARMVEAARGSAVQYNSELGKTLTRTIQQQYEKGQMQFNSGEMLAELREAVRREAAANPILRRDARRESLFGTAWAARKPWQETFDAWLGGSVKYPPSRAEFDLFLKVMAGGSPALLFTMSQPNAEDSPNYADLTFAAVQPDEPTLLGALTRKAREAA